ncbi:H-NS histone family protein [Burkholderia oklahomensis]|uniref:H-NS histone family protein n=1 Tax=Burkholderia oklahomensis TaxID=342113 RepID=A0AAI8FQ93_9BURK|nr:H-NS histone family protein [Burkholderia oklahomensis]AIO68735.1 H-NS histone family protein [Burkholderia oklahomensis]AJX36137.1 H-NS histone family protein [Burkholderia oklahomensis C6786]AOI39535.1 DNA-binding protein [Burkholderia oklahomensis EO147]AOI49214.1 DNA-binding protein [Burkholderia oklahomensis C6786]KUY51468.1 DNA-binding protein [Burkholderia oklahomensis EO147]
MATYKELLAQLDVLKQQAKTARAAELPDVLVELRRKIVKYGLTQKDLFPPRLGRPKKADSLPKPRYRDPETGATWTGRGRAPAWIAGQDRERFLIE